VQESTRQLTAAAAALTKAAESVPRSVPVDFLQGWRWPTALVLGPVVVMLLVLWGLGAFSGVSQAKYDHLLSVAQEVGAERDFYQGQIQKFRKDMGTTKEMRKTTQQLFPPYASTRPANQP
jgi:outer membrane murein-binding lipoprotein Lpp